MRLALYLLSYKLWCDFMGQEFNSRTANSAALMYKGFRSTPKGRAGNNYTIRKMIKKLRGEN